MNKIGKHGYWRENKSNGILSFSLNANELGFQRIKARIVRKYDSIIVYTFFMLLDYYRANKILS